MSASIQLKDIIDLEYLLTREEGSANEAEIRRRRQKDRAFYQACGGASLRDRDLLLAWLDHRRRDETGLLPGELFSRLHAWMTGLMVISGLGTGLILSWSFLAYHGTRPVNVTLYFVLFIGLQALLALVTTLLLILRRFRPGIGTNAFAPGIMGRLSAALCLNGLPALMKKAGRAGADHTARLEDLLVLIRVKTREYRGLFFWPFFILTAAFAFCFTLGSLAGTFFRIMVSDMAFGWQSTLVASGGRIHDLVSFIALPWSGILPEHLALPSLTQIEGSRIILKEGIATLATHDLVSWWPFLCMGLVVYAVIPRGLLLLTGILARRSALERFDPDRPMFRRLLIQLQSRVLDIEEQEFPKQRTNSAAGPARPTAVTRSEPPLEAQWPGSRTDRTDGRPSDASRPGGVSEQDPGPGAEPARILFAASASVYSDTVMDRIIEAWKPVAPAQVRGVVRIRFDPDEDEEAARRIMDERPDQMVLVHEVWQPPIRGLLHYIRQMKSILPDRAVLWVLLTGDPAQADFSVDEDDVNYEIWKRAVFRLEDPGIQVRRMV